jgi:isopenicillin-N N-acyltransferase-like protein
MAARFPIVTVAGTPREVGRAYGAACRDRIASAFDYYSRLFVEDSGIAWPEAVAMGEAALPLIQAYDSEIIAELDGLAEAIGRSLAEVTALHMKTEIRIRADVRQPPEGCTTLAVLPEAALAGGTIVGKNWDWTVGAQELGIVLRKRYDDGRAVVTLTEAGLIGRDGCNGDGIAVVANALAADQRHDGLPLHIIVNRALKARTMNAAMKAVLAAPRESAMAYLMAHRQGMALAIEAAPFDHNVVWERDGILTHTNHFLIDNPRFRDTLVGEWPDTLTRWYRADKLLRQARGNIGVETVKAILSDRFDAPYSISTLPAEGHGLTAVQTNGSIIIDLATATLHVASGPPDCGAYEAVDCRDILD